MPSTDTAAAPAEPIVDEPTELALPAEAAATWEAMFAAVPESDDAGLAAIIGQITDAASAADLDAPWRSEGLTPYTDRELLFRAIRKRPSDYVGGLPWFLVVDAADPATGEALTLTTGAVSVVAQLVRAHAIGALPLQATVRRSKRPSAKGYHAYHLEVRR